MQVLDLPEQGVHDRTDERNLSSRPRLIPSPSGSRSAGSAALGGSTSRRDAGAGSWGAGAGRRTRCPWKPSDASSPAAPARDDSVPPGDAPAGGAGEGRHRETGAAAKGRRDGRLGRGCVERDVADHAGAVPSTSGAGSASWARDPGQRSPQPRRPAPPRRRACGPAGAGRARVRRPRFRPARFGRAGFGRAGFGRAGFGRAGRVPPCTPTVTRRECRAGPTCWSRPTGGPDAGRIGGRRTGR